MRCKLYLLLSGLFVFSYISVDAQPKKASDAFINAVNISYFAPWELKDDSPNVSLGGLKIGFEHLLNSGRQSRTNERGQLRRAKKEYIFAGNIGYYGKKDYHYGVFLNVETGARYILGPGLIFEGFIGVGAMKRIVEEKPKGTFFTEDFGAAPIAALGIGIDFKTIASVPVYMCLKGGALGMYPTEQKTVMPSIEISFTYIFDQLR